MTGELLALVAAGLVILLVGVWRGTRKPTHLITLQKSTNVNQQAEIVTVQRNLYGWASVVRVWREIENAGLAATARMQSINEDILDNAKREAEQIAAAREKNAEMRTRFLTARRKRKLARSLGKPVHEITDEMVQAAARPVEAPPEAAG